MPLHHANGAATQAVQCIHCVRTHRLPLTLLACLYVQTTRNAKENELQLVRPSVEQSIIASFTCTEGCPAVHQHASADMLAAVRPGPEGHK